jgi:rhodanese-related sulfurtransferase
MKILSYKFLLGSVVTLVLAGCLGIGEKGTTSQASLLVINVLGEDLYKDAHIKGSINVPFDQIEQKSQSWNKNIPLVIYCSNYQCTASEEAAHRLAQRGFTTYAYEGGTAEWYQHSKTNPRYVIEGPSQQKYLTMVLQPIPEENKRVKTVTAEELYKMMEQAGLLK